MCSSPKGRSSKPHSLKLESLTSAMDYADYSKMVHRANESYERRQQEKALRKQNQAPVKPFKACKKNKPVFWSFSSRLMNAFKKIFISASPQKEPLS